MPKKIPILLEVDAHRALDLVAALRQRDYINIIDLSREERKARKNCPACGHKFPREVTYRVTDEMVEALVRVVSKMRVAKSVVLINKATSRASLPPHEVKRATSFNDTLLKKAEVLGLIKAFQDGGRLTYFATAQTLALFSGKPINPSIAVIAGGEVIERSGELLLDEFKFKDRVTGDKLVRAARDAAAALSQSTVEFVMSGQMSLDSLG